MLLCWQIGSSHCREHTWISHDPQSIFRSSSVWISSVNVWWIYIKGEVTPENLSFNEQSRDGTQRDYFALSSSFIGLLSYSIFYIFPVHSFYLSLQYSNSCPIPHFPRNPVSPSQLLFFSLSFHHLFHQLIPSMEMTVRSSCVFTPAARLLHSVKWVWNTKPLNSLIIWHLA